MDDAERGPHLDRRGLLKAGVWAAPVIVLATAAPARAASTGDVPIDDLVIQSYGLSDVSGQGIGPLQWAGGQVEYEAADPATAMVSYTVVITLPDGSQETLTSGGLSIPAFGSAELTGPLTYGVAPMVAGDYTLTSTVYGSDGSKSAVDTVTLTG